MPYLSTNGIRGIELESDIVPAKSMRLKDDVTGDRKFEPAGVFCDELEYVERLFGGEFATALRVYPPITLLGNPFA